MAALNELPYMLVSRTLPGELGSGGRVFICVNLIDHRALGIGASREDAMEAMRLEYIALNAPDAPPAGDGGATAPRFSIN